jgi:hypothetical protein
MGLIHLMCNMHVRPELDMDAKSTESAVIHEAFTGCLTTDDQYVEILKQRISAADRGEFASDREIDGFFADFA